MFSCNVVQGLPKCWELLERLHYVLEGAAATNPLYSAFNRNYCEFNGTEKWAL